MSRRYVLPVVLAFVLTQVVQAASFSITEHRNVRPFPGQGQVHPSEDQQEPESKAPVPDKKPVATTDEAAKPYLVEPQTQPQQQPSVRKHHHIRWGIIIAAAPLVLLLVLVVTAKN
jgi:hypothetical protein